MAFDMLLIGSRSGAEKYILIGLCRAVQHFGDIFHIHRTVVKISQNHTLYVFACF